MSLIDPLVKNKIKQILSVIETGSINGNYSAIAILKDGKAASRQITYGKHQVTEQGKLKKMIGLYANDPTAKFGRDFMPYLDKIGLVPLADDINFITLLRSAGADQVMKATQDLFFDTDYWLPAEKFFNQNVFTLPLSMLTVYDSYIHSGGILPHLRAKFPETVPAAGGDEKKWIQAYLGARNNWLAESPNPILQKTVYRTKAMLNAAQQNNWLLDQAYAVNGHVVK